MKRILLLAATAAALLAAAPRYKPKVVIVVTFERGADTGDEPGEYQYWVEREKLTTLIPFTTPFPHVRINKEGTILGVISGMGASIAAANLMQLALDPRFDLSQSYWLVNGTAGVDPEDASVGSAAWARYVIDGDFAQELDAREIPPDWPYGRLVVRGGKPNVMPNLKLDAAIWHLNDKLVDWAYQLTKSVELTDTPEMAALRKPYTGVAAKPPFVLIGDSIGSSTWWHGRYLNQWANDWSKLWTNGKANQVMTNREDNGIATALKQLSLLKRADFDRVLFLRAASNYSAPAPGQSAAESLNSLSAGFIPSLEACWRVGSPVVRFLASGQRLP